MAQTNLHIWHNESNYRKGIKEGNNLELTHGLNGVRNTAKNKIQEIVGGRKDYKIDCLAAEFKDWEISWDKGFVENESFASVFFDNKQENSFDSLEQQIDYFKDVKTLVGLTGAGLTNSVFMQPETNLVEIASPIIFYNRIYSTSIVDFSEAQHFFYSKIFKFKIS